MTTLDVRDLGYVASTLRQLAERHAAKLAHDPMSDNEAQATRQLIASLREAADYHERRAKMRAL